MGCGNTQVNGVTPTGLKFRLPDNISSTSKSIVKLDYPNKACFGFLIKFFKEDKDFFCLLTAGENISQEMLERKESIKFFYDNESKIKKINLDSKERFIKNFKDIGINVTVVEILSSDEIEKECFLLPVINYVDEFKELKNEEVITVQNQKRKLSYLPGKIKDINKYEFIHSINTEKNSFGLPIFLKDDTKVIGVQQKENEANFIGPIFNFLKSLEEKDNQKINIKSSQIKKEMKNTYETKNYSNEANYKNGKKVGNREIKYENGNYYKGEERNGKREGKGIEYYKNGEIKYDGDWNDDMPEGKGKFIDENGNYYIGEFKKGLKHGKGIEYNKKGKIVYEGDFINGKKEGEGKLIYDDGYYYIGPFKNDSREGKGKICAQDGNTLLEGNFVNNKIEGIIKEIYDDGSYYIGHFKDKQRHGKGTIYDEKENIIYEGDFFKNKIEGNGKYIYKSGYYYIGQFKNGERNGK